MRMRVIVSAAIAAVAWIVSLTAAATNSPPAAPVNTSPLNGAVSQALTPVLAASAFSDPDVGDTHAGSQWQLSPVSNFAANAWDSGDDAAHLTIVTVPVSLSAYMRYYWHVRYKDNNGAWSQYSSPTWFDTVPTVNTNPLPVIQPRLLDFSSNETAMAINVANAGGGSFAFTVIVNAVTIDIKGDAAGYPRMADQVPAGTAGGTQGGQWLGVSPLLGVVSNQPVSLIVTANRSSMTNGLYRGTVTVALSDWGPVVVTCQMVVAGNSVIANPGGPYVTDQGAPVTLDGSASVGNNLSYMWRIDSGPWSAASPSNRFFGVTNYIPGTNAVSLIVGDNSVPPLTDSASTLLLTRNVAPMVDAGGPYTGAVNQTINFHARVFDPGTGDVLEIRWDFGSGFGAWQGIAATNTARAFATSGTRPVQCEVKDNYGGTNSDTALVMIGEPNQPPVAVAHLGMPGVVYSNFAGMHLTAMLNGSSSHDDYTATSNLYFDWRENVNNPVKPLLSEAAKHQSNAVITFFPLPGVYRFTLVVNDGQFNSAAATVQVNVPGLAGVVRSEGISRVLPLYGVTLTTTNQALGQVFSSTSDMEGKYALDTGAGNGRLILMTRSTQARVAAVNVDEDGALNYTLTFMPRVCTYSLLVNSGYYGGAWAAIPYVNAQIVIGNEVGFSDAGNLAGELAFGGIPELWPRTVAWVNYQVMVQKANWESQVLALQANPDDTLRDYPTLHASDACTVQGTVVGTNDMPVAGIKLEFGPAYPAAYSDSDGGFTLSNVMRGQYYVRLSASDFETTYAKVLIPSGDTNFTLPQALKIRGGKFSVYGEILDAQSGLPIANATISVMRVVAQAAYGKRGAEPWEAIAASQAGYYDVTVDKGVRTLLVTAPGHNDKSVTVSANSNVQQPVSLTPEPGAVLAVLAAVLAGWRRRRNR